MQALQLTGLPARPNWPGAPWGMRAPGGEFLERPPTVRPGQWLYASALHKKMAQHTGKVTEPNYLDFILTRRVYHWPLAGGIIASARNPSERIFRDRAVAGSGAPPNWPHHFSLAFKGEARPA